MTNLIIKNANTNSVFLDNEQALLDLLDKKIDGVLVATNRAKDTFSVAYDRTDEIWLLCSPSQIFYLKFENLVRTHKLHLFDSSQMFDIIGDLEHQ